MAQTTQKTTAESPARSGLDELISFLHATRGRPSVEALGEKIRSLDITFDDVADAAGFGATRYQRNLLHHAGHFHVLVLCWRAGQRSPIHDHRGSVCGVRVLRGTATETVFERAPGGLKAAYSRDLPTGEVVVSRDSDVHQMSNLQGEGQDLVTLHVYAPPLIHMNQYSITDPTPQPFDDPIVGHIDGSGI